MMSGRERFLTAIENKKPDRLPCQVHNWMEYYLDNYLDGMDSYDAYEYFGMDPVIYCDPKFEYSDKSLANWREKYSETGYDESGNMHWQMDIETPGGPLRYKGAKNKFNNWATEGIIKDEESFEIWIKFIPTPVKVDWTPVREAKKRIGDKGIVRGSYFDFGQGSPWQSFACRFDTQPAIMSCFDNPDWVHYALKKMLEKKLKVIELGGKFETDLVETGGGAGSSTVISPQMHREFCLPYDIIQHNAFHEAGTKIVYHLCGGLMPLLEIVAENGADGLETMTPPDMGGDCNLREAEKRVGDKLFFIGGFDQNNGFDKGTPETVRKMVFELHEACNNGGYICSPSDHFFTGDPENIKAFARAAEECVY